ncbi:MAG: hypothetical protein D6824_01155 [Planctomycetota bacterium]|nr:MAG: hypothetical protein D6824_01155 [Planctomycetota bacterium]
MRDRTGARLLAGATLSALLHAAALSLAGLAPVERLSPAKSPRKERSPKVLLGEPTSRRVSVNWLGFAQPRPHEATVEAPVDQPALSPVASPAPPARAPQVSAMTEPVVKAPPSAQRSSAIPAKRTKAAVPAEAALRSATPLQARPAAPPVSTLPPAHAPPPEPSSAAAPPQRLLRAGGEPALRSPRESDAFSRRTAIVARLGRPVVAEGVSITTVRPRFSLYTRLVANPRNPLVEVQFDRRGVVRHARIVESSGRVDVDDPVLDAVYRWKAKGKAIEALASNEGGKALLTLRFRIALR